MTASCKGPSPCSCTVMSPAVKTVLAELLVATSLLTATLKFAGDITVQLQGDGP
jgi:redox-regulated HSP33 family molecular chaperone